MKVFILVPMGILFTKLLRLFLTLPRFIAFITIFFPQGMT